MKRILFVQLIEKQTSCKLWPVQSIHNLGGVAQTSLFCICMMYFLTGSSCRDQPGERCLKKCFIEVGLN